MPVSSLFRDLDALTQETGASKDGTPREEAALIADDGGYAAAEAVQELVELEKEIARLQSRVGHIKSQKRVLRSTLQVLRESQARFLQSATIPQHADAKTNGCQPCDGTTAENVSQLHRSGGDS